MDVEAEIRSMSPDLAMQIQQAAASAHNEAEFRTKVTRLIDEVAGRLRIPLHLREEYTLLEGRADAVYNRLVLEYKAPGVLRESNSYKANKDAIEQVKDYVAGLVRRERRKPERLAGVILDGNYFIFTRHKEGAEHVDNPQKVSPASAEHFLKLLASLSTELALIPENLVRDFGENRPVSRKTVSALYKALTETQNPKARKLFEQWSLQFGEVCDYERASKLSVDSFARRCGITGGNVEPFPFFFCLHTYYATFIKLLAVQVVHYYIMPKLGTDIRQAASYDSGQLRAYFEKMEDGGIFREVGIANFMEGDFFRWYLDVWDEPVYQAAREVITALANYSMVTLDVDPDTTRDLLKKLYEQLMPRELRHNLGEYYTPDWLAERLLNMLEGGRFEGNPNKRLIDPACGSGTFLVIAIKKIREYAADNVLPESQVLDRILANVVGFDLNPLAVISARTNYLLALGDLLQHRRGDIDIPVYMCDSVLTPREGRDLFGRGILRFNTAVGPFSLPKSLIAANLIDQLANLLEESVKLNLSREQFTQKLCQRLPLIPEKDGRDIEVVCDLYENLLSLEKQGINGVWARIIKNAFAPLYARDFDYVAGNPPWVNWESLPENYRQDTKPLWVEQGLFPHGGMDTILGKGKKDISMLMTYVAMQEYLKTGGKLAFVITQSVFKTTGAGQGFRRFLLGNGERIQVQHVDDMVKLQPFEGAANRTSVVVLQKGRRTRYPMRSYLYWRKTVRGALAPESSLDDILEMTERKQFAAEPVSDGDPTSAWLTGKPRAVRAVKKVLGQSDYEAHAGCYSGGANGVYWMDIWDRTPEGLVVVSNITEGAKRKVEGVQAVIEPDLLYPLLRGRDVKRWQAEPSAHILMAQDPEKRQGIDEDEMKTAYPKTYLYLKRFEPVLRERKSRGVSDMIGGGAPFYTMFAVGDYTFAPHKVVWTRLGTVEAAAIETQDDKPVIPQETITLVECDTAVEAHYIACLVNSSIFQYAVTSYSQAGGKSMGSMHVLESIRIPTFDADGQVHRELAGLSENAHHATGVGDVAGVRELEQRMDELAAQIWGLSPAELKEIQTSLEELA